jgi:hypothetical protein
MLLVSVGMLMIGVSNDEAVLRAALTLSILVTLKIILKH